MFGIDNSFYQQVSHSNSPVHMRADRSVLNNAFCHIYLSKQDWKLYVAIFISKQDWQLYFALFITLNKTANCILPYLSLQSPNKADNCILTFSSF